MAWPPRVLDSYPLTLLHTGKETVPLQEEPGSPGVVISPALTASETLYIEPITTPEDEAEVANCDRQVADLFLKSLAGSYREGTLRCIMDITETFPDRPAGVYDVARGHAYLCRRTRGDPFVMVAAPPDDPRGRSVLSRLSVRSSSVRACPSLSPSSFQRTKLTICSISMCWKVGPVRRGFASSRRSKSGGTGASSSSAPMASPTPTTQSWRSRRSVSRIRYGKQVVKVVRLADPKAGFGRRKSPAPGEYQLLNQSRKQSPPQTMIQRVPGTTVNACKLVERKAMENIEFWQKMREMIAAGRPASVSRPGKAPSSSRRPTTPP